MTENTVFDICPKKMLLVQMLVLCVTAFISCTSFNNQEAGNRILVPSEVFYEDSFEYEELVPNYEMELISIIPIGKGTCVLPLWTIIPGKGGPNIMNMLTFAIDPSGSIYIGVSGDCLLDGFKVIDSTPSSIIKISTNGEVVGQIFGGISPFNVFNIPSKDDIIKKEELLKKNNLCFSNIDEIVSDTEGYTYINDSGVISVCDPEFKTICILNIGISANDKTKLEIVFNERTGGVVIKDKNRCYVELKKGVVIENKLPRYYDDEYLNDDICILEYGADHSILYTAYRWFSDDKEYLFDAGISGIMGFNLDLKRSVGNISYVGHSNYGWLFDIKFHLESKQILPERIILMIGGNNGYCGHILPQYKTSELTQMVGQDGQYYEFAFLPDESGLHIFRAREITGKK